ncbi:MAG: chain length determinant protein EpsF [Rubrivivax sp.]|nr:MAG: chain length determinant protein EpsF [Rubrivivax sp.]
MSFTQFISILKARWITVVAVLLVTVTLAVTLSLVLPKKYTASGVVVMDFRASDPISGLMMQNSVMPGYTATQVDVIQSERVSQKVIEMLKLAENPGLREQWMDETSGQGVFQSWLSDLLQRNLDVTPGKESSTITVSYTAVDPQFASAMANAYIRAYIQTTLDLRVEPARQFSKLFDEQIKQTRQQLETAQTKLSEYQRSKGILATDERLDVETARLGELSAQLVALQSQTADAQSRKAQAGANSPEVLASPVIAGLRADMSRQQAKLQELSAKFGPAHPQVQELQANIKELQIKLESETRDAKASMGISSNVNLARERQFRATLEAQREKLMTLKKQRDDAAVLQRDVENAQRSYDLLQGRLAQTTLESQNNQTNVSMLKMATPPFKASSPRIVLNTIVSLILGTLLGIGAAIVRELMNRKLRLEQDVTETLGVPMLGSMPAVAEAKRDRKLPVGSSPRLAAQRGLPELIGPGQSS